MIFREGITPEWEDVANAQGGHFQFVMKATTSSHAQIDEYWNNLVLGMVGETMDAANQITGVRLVDKLGKGKATDCLRVELWYNSKATPHEVNALKRSMEKCLLARIDGSQGSPLKDMIQDKKHKGS